MLKFGSRMVAKPCLVGYTKAIRAVLCVCVCVCVSVSVCEREGERERREVRDQRTNSLVAGPMRRKRFLSYRR